jgi:hypothetical protein
VSFLAALVHFSLELLVFKTMSLKSAANPLIIAGWALFTSYELFFTDPAPSCHVPGVVPNVCTRLRGRKLLFMNYPGLSALWMGAGWNYYTNLATEIE